MRRLPLWMMCVSLSACASDSRSDLAREVRELADAGMASAEAQGALRHAGFRCRQQPRDEGGMETILCNRERSHRLFATCVQNVYLTVSDDRVERLDVPDPSCAGM